MSTLRVENVLRRRDIGKPPGQRHRNGASPERKYVPSAPLALAVITSNRWTTAVARDANLDPKILRQWQTGLQRQATWGAADAVLVALERFWWEVFDPEDGPRGAFSGVAGRDVVAWIAAAQAAVLLWDPDEEDADEEPEQMALAMAGAL